MWILLSGEGATDIGRATQDPGPITLGLSQILENAEWGLGYSFVESEHYSIVSETDLSKVAKTRLKPKSMRGSKRPPETRFFYKNARALALLAKDEAENQSIEVMPILFRDADGTASSDRGEWKDKWQSMLDGFAAEEIVCGVPILPKPKSEAWIICALVKEYRNCSTLEARSGNDASTHSLKQELADHLEKQQQQPSREFFNDQVIGGTLDFAQINDMPSFQAFYDRLQVVLKLLKVGHRSGAVVGGEGVG